ncbi:MAG: BCCT family transporter [Granulosicoccus sp.]
MSDVVARIGDNTWREQAMMPVFLGSCILPLMLIVATVLYPTFTAEFLRRAGEFYLAKFPHWILWSISFFLICTMVVIVLPRIGELKLGLPEDRPQTSFFSWFSIIFGAGMGVGLLTWGVAEPLAGMQNNPDVIIGFSEANSSQGIPSALKWTYAHWGLAGWAGYAIVGLAVAYTGHRQRLPLTIRTALLPIFGNAMKGSLGQFIDMVTVAVTLLCVVQILGFALEELVFCIAITIDALWLLEADGGVKVGSKIGASIFIMLFAAASAISGLGRGVKWVSNANMLMSITILALILMAGSFVDSINALFFSASSYLRDLPILLLKVWMADGTETMGKLHAWQSEWTMFHWTGWWLAFSPFIGIFLAKVSKGRTIRQYVFATVILPAFLTMVWMSFAGGNAIWLELNGTANGELIKAGTGQKIFSMVEYLFAGWPATIVSIVLVLLLITYLTTSIDSAIIVVNTVLGQESSRDNRRAVVGWTTVLIAVMILLILLDGFSSIRSAMVVSAAPISVLMSLLCVSLGVAIYKDENK